MAISSNQKKCRYPLQQTFSGLTGFEPEKNIKPCTQINNLPKDTRRIIMILCVLFSYAYGKAIVFYNISSIYDTSHIVSTSIK